MDESTTDESGKQFAPLPNSSHFFVVVGRNVDQWRASLGLEEGIPWGCPRQRSHLVPERGTPSTVFAGHQFAQTLFLTTHQRAKKVVSDSSGLVDFAIRLLILVLNLPNGQVLFFGEIQITEGL